MSAPRLAVTAVAVAVLVGGGSAAQSVVHAVTDRPHPAAAGGAPHPRELHARPAGPAAEAPRVITAARTTVDLPTTSAA